MYVSLYIWMCVFVCECMFIYLCIFVYICMYLCVSECICIYLCISVCIFVCICVYICVYVYVSECIWVYLWIFVCIWVYVSVFSLQVPLRTLWISALLCCVTSRACLPSGPPEAPVGHTSVSWLRLQGQMFTAEKNCGFLHDSHWETVGLVPL